MKQTVWQGKSWRLQVEQVTLPNGDSAEKGSIDHPGAVVIVPMLGDDVVLIHQYRAVIEQHILELPAGTRDGADDEDVTACAQRELREETGYRAAELINLGDYYPAPGYTNELYTLFLARGLTHDPLPMDVDEEIENRPIPLTEAVQKALRGEIPDCKTVLGLLRAQHYLQNE